MVRMVATDLDGTLLRSDGTISPDTRAAIDRARTAGIIVTVVTGRPPRWLGPIWADLGWHGLAVSANGAVLLDLDQRVVEQVFPIEPGIARIVVERVRDLIPAAVFAVERMRAGITLSQAEGIDRAASVHVSELGFTLHAFAHEQHYRPRLGAPRDTPTGPIEALLEHGDIVKLLAKAPARDEAESDRAFAAVAAATAGLVTVTHSTRSGILLEMSAAEVSKATGLRWLARAHGLTKGDVVAVGDMPNDLPMLRWATAGYAVANAHPAVLAAAGPQMTLPSNDDGGVVSLLNQLVDNKESCEAPHAEGGPRDYAE